MANLSNINNKLIVTDEGNLLVNATANLATYGGITIDNFSDPSIAMKTTGTSGWLWTQYITSTGTNNFSMGVNQTAPYWCVKAGAGMDSPHLMVDSSGNVGIGTTSIYPQGNNTILKLYSTSVPRFYLQNTTTGSNTTDGSQIYVGGSDLYITNSESANTIFSTNSLERMRITSNGYIRIGSNSSNVRLAINGWSYNPGSDGSGCVGLKQTGASSYGYVVEAATNDKWMMMGHNGTNGIIETTYATSAGHSDLYIKTGGSNYLVLQSSGGNVGIGITSPDAKLDVLQETRISYLQGNQYRTRITNTDGNTRILSDGQQCNIIFGTTGNVANGTASEVMRLNWEGKLGIGTTSPLKLLTVKKATSTNTIATSEVMRLAGTAQVVGNKNELGFANYDNNYNASVVIGAEIMSTAAYLKQDLYFATRDSTSDIAPTERMRITSDGSLARNSKKVWNFTAVKSFTEGGSSNNFFRLNFNGNQAVLANITLMSNNSATGSRTMQSVQAMLAVSYQGYLPTMTEISKTPVSNNGSSYISAVQGANGSLTFLCDTTNNSTGTSNTTFVSVELISNGALNASITVL